MDSKSTNHSDRHNEGLLGESGDSTISTHVKTENQIVIPEDLAWLKDLDEETLSDIEWILDEVLEGLEEASARKTRRSAISVDKTSSIKSAYKDDIFDLADRLDSGEIALDDFNKGMHDIISQGFRDAYQVGKQELDPGDEEWLNRAIGEELKYARKFGEDIEDGTDYERRVQMYANTLDGIAEHGEIETLPDSVRIHWMLGEAEHCEDCQVLAANSPYTKWNLPTTPRSGDTQCLSNCKCYLQFAMGKLSDEEMEDAEQYGSIKDQNLADLLLVGEESVPEGMRLSTDEEQEKIDELRNEMNYWRRMAADMSLDESERMEARSKRKEINAELIDYVQERKINDVPLMGVDDVLDGRVISRRAVKDIFRDGIDGVSLSKVSMGRLNALLGQFRKQIGEDF